MNNMIKKLLCICLAVIMVFSVVACKKTPTAENSSSFISSEVNANQETSSEDSYADSEQDLDYEDYDNDSFTNDADSSQLDTEENSFDDESAYEDDYLDEEEVFYEELAVNNAAAPVNPTFTGIGGIHLSVEYMPDGYGANRLPMEDWQVQMQYDRIADKMRIDRIRTYYGPDMVWDRKQQKMEWNPKKNAALGGFYKAMKEWQKRDVEVAITPIWALTGLLETNYFWKNPDFSAVDYTGFGGSGVTVDGDYETTLKNFRKFICDTVNNLEANGIHNIKYFMAFTECNNTYVYIDPPEGSEELPEDASSREKRRYNLVFDVFDKAIKALDAGIKDSGKRDKYKIVGPCDVFKNDFEYTDPEQYSILVEYTLKNLSDYVDIIGTHQYSHGNDYSEAVFYDNMFTTLGKTVAMAKKAGKEIWLDEFNALLNGDRSYADLQSCNANAVRGIAQAATICGMMNVGMDTGLLWSVADTQWPNMRSNFELRNGLQTGGLLPSPLVSTIPYMPWYSVSLLTRYMGGGKIYHCEQGFDLYISCVERNDGEWSVAVVNYNAVETPIHINFSNAFKNKTFYRHTYTTFDTVPTTSADIIGVSHILKNVTTDIHDTVPGFSVSVYTTDAT